MKKQAENILTEFTHCHVYCILTREWQDVLWCERDDETGSLSGEYASKKTEWFKEIFFFKLKSDCWIQELSVLAQLSVHFHQNPVPGSSQHQATRDGVRNFVMAVSLKEKLMEILSAFTFIYPATSTLI